MRWLFTLMVLALMASSLTAQRTPLAKDGMVRAAYLASNPAQAVKDPATGEARGVVRRSRARARAHARRQVTLMGRPNPQRVIDAVRNGEAEIGFVAYNPERAGPVEFSKPYLLVNQTFIVKNDSPIRVDRRHRSAGTEARRDPCGLDRAVSSADAETGTARRARRHQPGRGRTLLRDGTIDAFGVKPAATRLTGRRARKAFDCWPTTSTASSRRSSCPAAVVTRSTRRINSSTRCADQVS